MSNGITFSNDSLRHNLITVKAIFVDRLIRLLHAHPLENAVRNERQARDQRRQHALESD